MSFYKVIASILLITLFISVFACEMYFMASLVVPAAADDLISSAVISVGTTGVIHNGYSSWYSGTDLMDFGADYQHGASKSFVISQAGSQTYKTTADLGYKSANADTTITSTAPLMLEDRSFFAAVTRAADWYLCDPRTQPSCPTTRYETSFNEIQGMIAGQTAYESATTVYDDASALSANIEVNGSSVITGREDTIARYGYNPEKPVFNEEYEQTSHDVLYSKLSGDIRAQISYVFKTPK